MRYPMAVTLEMISRINLAALFITCVVCLETEDNLNITENQEACKKFGVNPNFAPALIVGLPWRIYYTWNVRMENDCVDMTAKNINNWTVNRFWTDMAEYLEEQPAWGAAVLFVTIGAANGEMLLFADKGPAGRVYGVPNIRRNPNFVAKKKSLPLLQFQMKLLREGKYLAIMDCLSGMATLSGHFSEEPPNRAEIESVAKQLAIGNGFPACKTVSNEDSNPLHGLL